ncbi:MAG: hypothetical protein A2W91_12120 [Bacteroidetes bacterium GWF2_38_335]|nr:MAG: hypothetical protein A2W91_12120 [Bacteroidetes bacterium GWF2_38_335]OFY76919.1 MAG: hypothetical protein A2281_00235 [Bacteroidetes bacterium RIFOXYA12_FULL_38_20]HBS86768.1 hypothetical protein [Bacteroidales bacterium]
MKTITILTLALLLFITSYSQKENYIWYFGDQAGIDFNTAPPTVLTNSAMQSYEGTSVVCDNLGNLLFYTNGGSFSLTSYSGGIWNNDHVLMPNGDLSSTSGCNSAFQSCLIVPYPGDSNQYYVFTNDCNENSYTGGTRYNIVDMTLDGGNGDVTTKNVSVQANSNESMLGIQHSNETDYWVIVHENTAAVFHSILVSSTGVSNTITSAGNAFMPQYGGQLAVTSSKTKIVYTANFDVFLYDFNNTTGAISNAINLGIGGMGAAFSSNDKFLYVYDNMNKQLCQFDMQAADIPASKIIIATTSGNYGALMLAPDCKIYIASGTTGYDGSLAVIENPNTPDIACGFSENAFSLEGKKSVFGLPNCVNNFFTCSSVSVNDVSKLVSEIKISPNPVSKLSDLISSSNLENCSFDLYDGLGRKIFELSNITGNTIPLKGCNIPSGMYYYNITDSSGKTTKGKLLME